MNDQLPSGWEIRKSKAGKIYYRNKVTGTSQWNLPTEPVKGADIPLPSGWVEKISRTNGTVYYYNTRLKKSQWNRPVEAPESGGPVCQNLRGLKWTDNSCYLDSALLALFATPTDFTNNLINMDLATNPIPPPAYGRDSWPCGHNREEDLANRRLVQAQLRHIAQSIRGEGPFVEYCFNLRQTFKLCPDPENYAGTGFADSGEFITYILNMFPLNLAQKKTVSYATNYVSQGEIPSQDLIETSTTYDCNASVIQFVPMENLKNSPDSVNISSFIRILTDSGELTPENLYKPYGDTGQMFKRRISVSTLEYTPYLIFNIKRIGIDFTTRDWGEVFLRKPITPEPEIILRNGQRFALSAVVMYTGGNHYVCTVKCGGSWYYFDDAPSKNNYTLEEMGTYEDVVRHAPYNPNTNGTQYYYAPIGSVPSPPVCPPLPLGHQRR
jgi:ubiquitin C-terminal hydrolase